METTVKWIIKRPKRTLLMIGLITVGLCATLGNLKLAQLRTEEQLREEDPVSLRYQQFTEEFGNDLDMLVAFETEEGLFTHENLQTVRDLTHDLEQLENVARVMSLANSDFQWVTDDEFQSRMFLDSEYLPKDEAGLATLKEQALNYEPFANRFLSDDAKVAVFVVRPKPGMMTALEAHAEMTTLVDEKYAALEVRMLGESVGFAAFQKLLGREAGVLMLMSLLTMAVLLGLCFRSFWGVILPGTVTLLSIVLTVTTYSLMGHTFSGISMMVSAILLAVALADAIHYYGHYREKYFESEDKTEANLQTTRDIFVPCFFTTLTTSVGFGSLVIATNLDLVYLAIHAAIGAFIAFGLTFTLMPAALMILPGPKMPKEGKTRFIHRIINGVWTVNQRYALPAALGVVVIAGLAISGLTKLTFDQDNLSMLPQEHSIIEDADFLANRVGIGGTTLQLMVEGEADAIKSQQTMAAIDRLEEHIRKQERVRKVDGLVDEMKITYQVINGNQEGFYKVPDNEDDFARLFYMLSDSEDIRSILNFDASKTVINVSMDQSLMSEYDHVIEAAQVYVQTDPNWPEGLTVTPEGLHSMLSAQYHALTIDQKRGFSLALILITLGMTILFRSVKMGLLSMIPNIVPVLVTLGFMGWTNIYVSASMIVVINIALGLAVDDTIHFLYAYRKYGNQEREQGVVLRKTLAKVGIPLIFTTFILMISLGAFTVSSMPMMVQIGMLLSLPIFTALMTDFFLLPALLKWLHTEPATANVTTTAPLKEVALEA